MAHVSRISAPLTVIMALGGACARSESSGAAEAHQIDSAAEAAPPAKLRVSSVMIGRRVGSGNRITEPTFQFAPQDTVYLSVATEGSGGADTLTAAWRFQSGEIVQQSSQPVRPAGENAAFALAKVKGLKPGTYKVIVFLGGDSVDTKVFAVKK